MRGLATIPSGHDVRPGHQTRSPLSFKTLRRPRMPVRSLRVAAMVGVRGGCGGGGGGSAEPEPQKPALSLSWQDSGFRTPIVTDPFGQSTDEKPGRYQDVATAP